MNPADSTQPLEKPSGAARTPRAVTKKVASRRINEREADLSQTSDYLQSIQEKHEVTNEDDQAANEVQSANDELRNIYEELEATQQAITPARHYAEAIVSTSPDSLLILNADLRIHAANEAFYTTFRLSAAEAQGRLIYDLNNHQWDTPKLRELLEGILPRMGFFDFEVTHEVNNGGRRTMLLNARALVVTPDQPALILLSIQDITELLHFQAEIRRSEQRYRRLFEAAKDGVLIMDLVTCKILDANPFMTELLGYAHQELLGKELNEIGLLQDEAANLAAFRELRKVGFVHYENLPLETKAGERRYVEMVSSLYREDEEQIIQCNVHDITKRKRAETQMRESEECYRTLVDQVKDYAIFRTNAEGVATTWNKGVKQVLGFDEAEFIGRDIVPTIFTPEDVQSGVARRNLDQAASEGAARDDCWMMRKGGTRFFAAGITTSLRNEAGTLLGFIKIIRDQTERKRLEEELQRYAADLSEGDRRKNEFLAMLAHELRNFLAPIRNAVPVLRLTCGDKEALQTVSEMMERQVDQMVRLVDDLLDVSRVSRCKIKLRREKIELASAVYHAVEAARSMVQCKDHELTVTLPPQPLYLNADSTRLAQIVGNLLNNACKFTGKSGRISLMVAREGGEAVIRVRDSGIGIAADQLPRIFDMFMQADTSLERTASGLGIGLPLVKSLVEMHDGTLEAHSEGLGQGSEFVVRLPILVEASSLLRPEPTVSEPTTTPALRILVVDDNRDSAISLAMLLKLAGHETHTAHDGLEAVEAAEKFRPEVILLDIGLPKLNGYEACRKIREQPWGRSMVLLALTGWGQEEDRQKSRDAGFNSHLVKPANLAVLKKLLAELPPKERSIMWT